MKPLFINPLISDFVIASFISFKCSGLSHILWGLDLSTSAAILFCKSSIIFVQAPSLVLLFLSSAFLQESPLFLFSFQPSLLPLPLILPFFLLPISLIPWLFSFYLQHFL